MNKEWYQDLITKYKASQKTISRVNEIFCQADIRYADLEYEVIVAGFLDNDAISINEKLVTLEPTKMNGIKGPQKGLKSVAIKLLEASGFNVVDLEKAFSGGIADIIARNKSGESIAVECGPCTIRKAIEYLEKPKNTLWILTYGGILYEVKRGSSWNAFHRFYKSLMDEDQKKAVKIAFP